VEAPAATVTGTETVTAVAPPKTSIGRVTVPEEAVEPEGDVELDELEPVEPVEVELELPEVEPVEAEPVEEELPEVLLDDEEPVDEEVVAAAQVTSTTNFLPVPTQGSGKTELSEATAQEALPRQLAVTTLLLVAALQLLAL